MVLSNTAVPQEYGKFRQQVLRGEIPVNEEISMQMNRIDFLIESPDYYYDDEAIQGFINFCENELTIADGGDLTLLPSFKLWAEDMLAWFYFVDEKTWNPNKKRYEYVTKKKRLVNKQYLIVARGAAKSMYASCIQQYFLVADTTTTHQVVTAPTMKQAEETMNPARTAISRAREIEVRVMSIDKLQGLGTKVNSVDEWLSGKVKEDVIGALEQGASKVDDYVILATSSEGTSRNGVGDTIKLELQDILRGDYFDPHTSIWHYKLDDISEVGMPEMWLKANPNLGATVSYDTYQKDVNLMESVPSKRNDILAKRFGIPVEGASYFFSYEDTLIHRPQNFDNMICAMGGDLSQGDDFTAFTFLFPLGNGYFGVKTRAYVSDLKVRKLATAMRDKYQEFIDEGTLIVMEGAVLDMVDVYRDLDTFIMDHNFTVVSFGYDPYNAKELVEMWTREHGDYGLTVVKQGARTESVPLGELGHLASERLLLFDEELMKFAMGNSIAVTDTNGNRKLSKKRDSEKIDNVAALLDAWVAYKRFQEAFE
jgi:phage terminase large subunit-like protein